MALKKKKGDDSEEFRKIRICLLARPKFRPDHPPDYREIWCRPSKAAMMYEPSRRILLLSKPTRATSKYQPEPKVTHYVQPSSLFYEPTNRIIKLATHRKRPEQQELKPKLSTIQVRKLLNRRSKWLKRRAAPRGPPMPHKHKFVGIIYIKGKKVFITSDKAEREKRKYYQPKTEWRQIDEEHLAKLATPTQISPKYRIIPAVDNYKQKRESDLKTPVSKRLGEISEARELPREALLDLNYNPFKIPKKALQYVATPRVERLAKPIIRVEGLGRVSKEEVAEDVFKVPRRALTAICTKRVAELAMPVMRD